MTKLKGVTRSSQIVCLFCSKRLISSNHKVQILWWNNNIGVLCHHCEFLFTMHAAMGFLGRGSQWLFRASFVNMRDQRNAKKGLLLLEWTRIAKIAIRDLNPGGYPHVKAYGDVPPKWVTFSPKILRHGSHFGQKTLRHGSHFGQKNP